MPKGNEAITRLKRVLLNDKTLPNGLLSVLIADLDEVFKSYFDYQPNQLTVELDIDANGKYIVRIEAPVDRIKSVKVL